MKLIFESIKLVNFSQTHPLFLISVVYMGDMFRLSVSHHQALFLFIKIQILDKDSRNMSPMYTTLIKNKGCVWLKLTNFIEFSKHPGMVKKKKIMIFENSVSKNFYAS